MQLVEPQNHQVNSSEWVIQTFKNNYIARLITGEENFPAILWSYLIGQAQDSLNILSTSRVHVQLLAYQVLEGTHDFNRHPWSPPATKSTIFNPPEIRSSWGGRSLESWYIDPTWDHYRCLKLQVPTTGGILVSVQYKLYPPHSCVSIETSRDVYTSIARDIIDSVKVFQDQ